MVTFTYRVCDNGNPLPQACSANITYTVTVSGPVIWFVDDTAPMGGTGTLAAPFQTLGAAQTAIGMNTGQRVFLFDGTYSNGLTLNTDGWLIGQGVTDTNFDSFMGIMPPMGTIARPSIGMGTATAQGTVALATNARVRGLAINTSGATAGMTGTGGLMGVDVDQTTITTAGGTALSLNNVAGTVTLANVSKNGTGSAVSLTNVGANVTIAAGSIQNTTTGAILLDGGAGNFSYAGTLASISAGRAVEVRNKTAGATVTFSGAIGTVMAPLGGTGILLDNNDQAGGAGGGVTFSGGVNLSTGTNAAFTATNGGVVTVIGSTNTLATTTGTALNVSSTTIGMGGLTFQSISSNGAPNGIVLNNTGAAGGLTVTGNSSGLCGGAVGSGPPAAAAAITAAAPADCTGGVIQNSTGPGIILNTTRNVSLTRVRVAGSGDDGIQGTSVTNFTLASALIENNGNTVAEANLDFGGVSDTTPDGLFGTAGITNSTIRNSSEKVVSIRNQNGMLSLTVTGSQFTNTSANTGSDDGLILDAVQTASMTVNVQNSYFAANRGDHFQAAASNSAVLNVTFKNNTLTGGHSTALGQGITINAATGVAFGGYSGRVDYDIDGNNIQGAISNGIIVNLGTSGAAAVFDGFIRNNVIGTAGVALSCSTQANGIAIDAHGNGTHTVAVTNNTMRRCFDRGIFVLANDGNGALNLTVTGNSINTLTDTDNANGTPREAFNLVAGATSTNVFGLEDSHAVCLNLTSISGNMVGGAFKNGDIRLRQRFRTSIRLPGYAGSPFDTAAVISFLEGNNPGATATATANNDPMVTTDGYFGGAACAQPT
jgi:hypothetical protein